MKYFYQTFFKFWEFSKFPKSWKMSHWRGHIFEVLTQPALKQIKLKWLWVKTVWKKFFILFFEYNVADQINTHKTKQKMVKLPPLYKILVRLTHIGRPDRRRILQIFCGNLRNLSPDSFIFWPHIANVGSKSPFGKASVLKFAARPFFYFFTMKTVVEFYVS